MERKAESKIDRLASAWYTYPVDFCSQRADGVWELVDGLQRMGTILQLVGILRDDQGQPVSRLRLAATKTLPSLEGKYWPEDTDDPDDANALTQQQRILIKRAKIDVQIVKKESDAGSKYELFQSLNTTGSPLEPMEIRNCLLIMVNPSFSEWIRFLSEDENFRACVPLSENQQQELGDREMVARFLAFQKASRN